MKLCIAFYVLGALATTTNAVVIPRARGSREDAGHRVLLDNYESIMRNEAPADHPTRPPYTRRPAYIPHGEPSGSRNPGRPKVENHQAIHKQMYLFREDDTECNRPWGVACFPVLPKQGCGDPKWLYESVEVFPVLKNEQVIATATKGDSPLSYSLSADERCVSFPEVAAISGAKSTVSADAVGTDLDPVALDSKVPFHYIWKSLTPTWTTAIKYKTYATIVDNIAYAVIPGPDPSPEWLEIETMVNSNEDDLAIQEAIIKHWNVRLVDNQKQSPVPHPANKFIGPKSKPKSLLPS